MPTLNGIQMAYGVKHSTCFTCGADYERYESTEHVPLEKVFGREIGRRLTGRVRTSDNVLELTVECANGHRFRALGRRFPDGSTVVDRIERDSD